MDMVAGNADVMFDNLPSSMAQIKAGKLTRAGRDQLRALGRPARYCPRWNRQAAPRSRATRPVRGSACWRLRNNARNIVNRIQQEVAKSLATPP